MHLLIYAVLIVIYSRKYMFLYKQAHFQNDKANY